MAGEGAVLGTSYLRIIADTSKLTPAMDAAERRTKQVGLAAEKSIGGHGKAVVGLQRSYEGLGGVLEAIGGKYAKVALAGAGAAVVAMSIIRATEALGKAINPAGISERNFIFWDMWIEKLKETDHSLSSLGIKMALFGELSFLPQLPIFRHEAGDILATIPAGSKDRGMSAAAVQKANETISALQRQRAELDDNRAAIIKLNSADDTLLFTHWKQEKVSDKYAASVVKETAALRDHRQAIQWETRDLQVQTQVLSAQLQLSQARGDVAGVQSATGRIDAIAAALLRLQNVPKAAIDKITEATKAMRAFEEARRAQGISNEAASMGLQILELTADRELSLRATEQQNFELQKQHYQQLLATATEKEELIADAHELMVARLKDINADYGKDWEFFLQRLVNQYADATSRMGDLATSTATNAEHAFGDLFFDVFKGKLNDIDDVFKSFLDSMLHEIANFMAKQATQALLKMVLNWYAGRGTSAGGSTFTGSPVGGQIMANGGILSGGFRAFAGGGIATSPTLGLVGEGNYNEAVVPLPDGSSIPVQMKGGGRGEKHEVIVSLDPGLLIATRPSAAEMQGAVAVSIRERGEVFREIDKMIRSR